MTPETKPTERGVPWPPDQVSPGDRILIHEDDGIVAIGRVVVIDPAGKLACQGSTSGALYDLGVRDQYVRLLRPANHVRIPDGTPVRLRLFDPAWATVEHDGTIKAALKAEDAMRYNVRYQVPKGFAALDGYAVALGVHPDDIELRPTGEDEPKPAPDPVEDDPATQLRVIDAALFNAAVPWPSSDSANVAQRVQDLIRAWVDLHAGAPENHLNPHLVNEMSTALRDISRLAVQHGGNEARTVYHQVVEALKLVEKRTANSAGTAGRVALRREVEVLLASYGAPKPEHWGKDRGDVMEWLDHALCIAREDRRERTALARMLTDLGASPAHTMVQMAEFVVAKTRADARANATAVAENAASARIEELTNALSEATEKAHQHELGEQQARETLADTESQHQELFRLLSYTEPAPHGLGLVERLTEVLEVSKEQIRALEGDKSTLLAQVGEAVVAPNIIRDHSLEAMSLLAKVIPGVEGFTLPQKLREVLAYLDDRISSLELAVASNHPMTVVAGPDRVRSVVSRALSDRVGWAVENLNRMLNEDHDAVGGWFLRTLANANLAVVVYDWEGIDPLAEPVEPTIKVESGPQFAKVEEIFASVGEALKPVLDEWRRNFGGKP